MLGPAFVIYCPDLERIAPRAARRRLSRLGDEWASGQNAVAILESALEVSGVAAEPLLVAVDDYHVAQAGSELERCFDRLFRRLPSAWRILVASREDPASREFARLLQYGEVGLLTEVDLAFTVEETAAFLSLDRPPGIAEAQAHQVHPAASGWPAGIVLLGRSLAGDASYKTPPAAVGPTTYQYFAREVLAEAQPDLRDFLLRTSILPFLEPALCDATLDRSGSAQQLARLVRHHLFLTARHNQPGSYRYHALFQEFLLAELRSVEPPAAVRDLRRRAVDALLRCGQIEEAAEQMIELADWDGLAALLHVHGESLIHTGRTATVLRWLDHVPEDAIAGSPWLLLFRGRCLRLREIPADLRSIQRRAQTLFTRQGERKGRAIALLEEARVAKHERENAEAVALCTEALAVVGEEPRVRSEILVTLVYYYTVLGRLPEAQAAGQEALALLPQISHVGTQAVHRVLLKRRIGLACAYAGDFHRGLALLREACDLAEAGDVDECTRVPTLHFRASAAAMRGDFDEALAELDVAGRMAAEYRLEMHARRIRATRGEILTVLGQLDLAQVEYERSGWLCDDWSDAGYFYYRSGQYDKAIDLYESEIARTGAAADPVNRARAQALLGATLVALGNTTAGKPLLEQALAAYRALGFQSRVPGIGLHLSDLAFAEGQTDFGEALLAEALAIAHTGGAYHFFALHPGILRRSLARARALAIEPYFVGVLRRRWQTVLSECSAPALERPVPDRAWASYRDLLEACPDEGIRADLIRAFADSQITAIGVQKLRSKHGFTWRELQIFVRYYLRKSDPFAGPNGTNRGRLHLAAELGLAEHTVRYYINSIRSKLGLGGQRGLAVYHWAVAQNIVE